MINQNLKSWEFGFWKGTKVILYIAGSAIVAYIANLITNYHPATQTGIIEVAIANMLIVWIQNWFQAHQAIKQDQQNQINAANAQPKTG